MRRLTRMATAAGLASALLGGLPQPVVAHHGEIVDKLERGVTTLVSMSSSGTPGDAESGSGCGNGGRYSASDNGRFVAFTSGAGNLHPADVNGELLHDVFVFDRDKKELDLVSALPNGLAPERPQQIPSVGTGGCLLGSSFPAISGNGRYVAFASNLPLDGNADISEQEVPLFKVFVRDLKKSSTELVSVTHDGSPAAGNSGTAGWAGLAISDNGRFVAFTSDAPNILEDACGSSAVDLVPGVSPTLDLPLQCEQIYVRDRQKNETRLVSVSDSGEASNFRSLNLSISGNGRYVAFESAASNLVPGDVNQCPQTVAASPGPSCQDVFLRDIRSGTTELISISREGRSASDASWTGTYGTGSQTISDDGRFVHFLSYATDILPTHHPLYPAGISGVYIRDRKAERTERVSVSSTGSMLQGASRSTTISDDGQYVLFNGHTLRDLFLGGTTTPRDEGHYRQGSFLYDRETGQLDWVLFHHLGSIPPEETPPPGTAMANGSIGGNGRFIVGQSIWRDADYSGDTGTAQVYIRDVGNYSLGVGTLGGPRPKSPEDSEGEKTLVCVEGTCIPPRGSISSLNKVSRSDLALTSMGAELYGVSIAHRPDLEDLLVVIELEYMPQVLPVVSPLFYGIRFKVQDKSYELRATSLSGGTFGLFHCKTTRLCSKVADLLGGYGTTGMRVVLSLPLESIGLERGGHLRSVEAFSALGSFQAGATRILDSLRLK